MFISHEKKMVFFRVTKTGSTTMQFCLWMSGAVGETDIVSGSPLGGFTGQGADDFDGEFGIAHLTPSELIDAGLITLEQLREYDCYAFLRPPRRRYLSGVIHMLPRHVLPEDFKAVAMDATRVSRHPKVVRTAGLINRAQSDYFFVGDEQVVTPLDFDNYEVEARRLIARAGGVDLPHIPRMNVRAGWKKDFDYADFWTPELEAKIDNAYADDLGLYLRMKNKLQ